MFTYIRFKACQDLWLIKAFYLIFSAWCSLSDVEGGGVHKQMLPTDLRKHGGGARCLGDLTTLGPADVAVTEMGTGRRNWSSGIKGSRFPAFFCAGLYPPNWAILEGRERWRTDEGKYVNTEEKETDRGREDWSVVLTVVTDVEFSTKLCQKPSCQG